MTSPAVAAASAIDGIAVSVDGPIGIVTFARPERLNAADLPMARRFIAAIDELDREGSIRAIIVTGAGGAFCAGADMSRGTKVFQDTGRRSDVHTFREITGVAALRLLECNKPVVAAVNGAAAGLGASITCAMDIRLAADSARFGFVFARRGMVPEGAAGWFLPRIVGIGTALEWACTGRMVSADEAWRAGLVNAVHPAADLLDAARALATEIATRTSPVAIAITRQLMWRGLMATDPMDIHKLDSMATFTRARSADVSEGVRAFLEKRLPNFPDSVDADMPTFYPWWAQRRFPDGGVGPGAER